MTRIQQIMDRAECVRMRKFIDRSRFSRRQYERFKKRGPARAPEEKMPRLCPGCGYYYCHCADFEKEATR